MSSRATPRVAALFGLTLSTAGCKGCGEEKPYVPFSMVETSASASVSAEPVLSAVVPASAFPAVPALAPERDARTITIDGTTFSAPPGRVFRWASPLTAPGKVLAWTARGTGEKGALVVLDAAGSDVSVYTLPAGLDLEHCSQKSSLARIAERVFALTLDLTCGESAQSVLVVAREEGNEVQSRYEATATGPLALSAGALDKDADGTADLVVVVSHRTPRGPVPISAELAYLDRPTGYAGDPSEPEASLGKLGKALLSHAVAKKADTLASAESALAFASALCGDAGNVRFQSSAGAPTCKESRVFGDVVHTAAIVADQRGDAARSVAASELAGSLKFEYGRVAQVDQLFAKKVTKIAATGRALEVDAPSAWPTAELRFDGENKLSVRTASGFSTLDPVSGETLPPAFEDAVTPPTFGVGDSTVTLLGVKRGCSPSTLVLVTSARGAERETAVPSLESAMPWGLRKEACASTPPSPALVALGDTKATLAVDGEVFDVTYGDDGIALAPAALVAELQVLPMLRSLFVSRGPAKERWIGKDMEGAHSCKASPDGLHVACFRAGKVMLYTKDSKPAKPKPTPKK